MGENEQGGMLRTVVVIGIIAMVALIMTLGVVGLKSSLRTNTLMAKDAGHNLVALTNNSISQSFTGYDYTQIHDNADGSAVITLPSNKGGVYGLVFTGAGDNIHSSFQTSDKWEATADIKTTNPDALAWYKDSVHATGLGIESSDAKWVSNPAFSTSYQKYVASGTKGQQWGTFVIYFKNNGSTPLEVTVKNITLSRVG